MEHEPEEGQYFTGIRDTGTEDTIRVRTRPEQWPALAPRDGTGVYHLTLYRTVARG